MNEYKVTFWERDAIWVRRTFKIKTEEPKTEEDIKKMIDDESIFLYVTDCDNGDYIWDTEEAIGYDSEDLEMEDM